jgi:vacuolar protein sorting-associated protein 8
MDVDLQAILNASESSDDELSAEPLSNIWKGHVSPVPGIVPIAASTSGRANPGNFNLDLEQILNEDDSSDESDEILSGPRFGRINSALTSSHVPDSRAHHLPDSSGRSTNSYSNTNHYNNDNYSGHYTSYAASTSHNPEDWAVLQAILVENDDDESDCMSDTDPSLKWMQGDFGIDNKTNLSKIDYTRQFKKYSIAEDITANEVLLADDGDDDDEIDMISTSPSLSETRPIDIGEKASKNAVNANGNPQNYGLRTSPKLGSNAIIDDGSEYTFMTEETSMKAFENALTADRRLLKSGHREIISPLMVKRRLKPKIELIARGAKKSGGSQVSKNLRLPGQQSSISSKFNFSGLVENKPMASVSKQIVKHADATISKVHCGLPTCLAFNSKFIAVGTQLGIILVFDLFEVLRQRLGASNHDENWQGAKVNGAITSIDLSHNGEAVIAGYTTGAIVLWDTIRGVVLRSVTDNQLSPITSVRFFNELKVVAVDAGGLVNKLTFTKNIIWSNYSTEAECLLDGTAGQILAVSVLSPYSAVKAAVRPTAFAKVLGKLTLMALSSERSSFVVAVDPKVNVLHRWARPPAERTDDLIDGSQMAVVAKTHLPCLAWGWALTSGGGNVVMPTLARAWGCCLQILCASFPTLDDPDDGIPSSEPIVHWPAFGVQRDVDALTPIVAIDWLNERTLVYLSESSELSIIDTVMMTMLERLDFSTVNLVFAEFSLSRGIRRENSYDDESVPCMIFQNSTRCSDDRLLVLCQDELLCISIVGARRRISSLEADGEWLEALAFALDHYENTVVSQEDRKRDIVSRRDISRHPEFSSAKSDDEEWIAKLLLRYLDLAVENAPEPFPSDTRPPKSPDIQRLDLAQSHFQMLCGVACEFCLAIRRVDLLFGPIFRKFQVAGYTNVFLDVLEPYVLNDKLAYIAPEVMSLFIDHCKATNGIAIVERCLLHMDCTIMDFDSILSLLRRNEMFTALFYVFNQGLDDYVTPLEILLEKVFDGADDGAILVARDKGGSLRTEYERLGYKSLVYISTCFNGKQFPRETTVEPEERRYSLNVELLNFLIQESFSPSSHVKKTTNANRVVGCRALKYPYLSQLLKVDPWCTLNAVSSALESLSGSPLLQAGVDIGEDWVDGSCIDRVPSAQQLIDVLSDLLFSRTLGADGSESTHMTISGAENAFLDFSTKWLLKGFVKVDKSITFRILERKSSQFASTKDGERRKSTQYQVLTLLSSLSRDSYDPDKVLEIFNRTKMHRAALLLHQQVASSWHDQADDLELRARHFLSAIDCYVGDDDKLFRKEVFHYIKKECSGITDISDASVEGQPKSLRDAVIRKFPALVRLDAPMTARLVGDLFADAIDQILQALGTADGGEGQFLFFQAVISSDEGHSDILNVTTEHHQMYLTLLARLHPEMVYEYLSTHDSYRNEDSLRLCQRYDIADASAYLLERMGNVSSALQLILQTLETKLMGLKRTIRGLGIDSMKRYSHGKHGSTRAKKSPNTVVISQQDRDIEAVNRILGVALDVCQRNSGSIATFSSDKSKFAHGELWFSVLDRLINAKGFLRLAKEQPEHAKIMGNVLSDLLRRTMQRMVSSVPLSDLVRKLTSDHSGSRIGELRELIECLLTTFGFELNVFQSAVSIFHADRRDTQRLLYDLQMKGNVVNSVMGVELDEKHNKIEIVHGDDILEVGSNNNAIISTAANDVQHQRSDTGLVDVISRLRRQRNKNVDTTDRSQRHRNLSMMTATEQLYQGNEIEPVVYDRFSGVLGEAEHRGRFMMFY